MIKSRCGLNCSMCEFKVLCNCGGCIETNGQPFHGECPVAVCCQNNDILHCGECSHFPCDLLKQYSYDKEHGDTPQGARIEQCRLWITIKQALINEFNKLGICDMENVTNLNIGKGSFVNLQYRLESGQNIKFWEEDKTYYINEVCKKNSTRCYGLVADEKYLLVCEYGENGTNPEIVVYKRWN